MPSQTAVKKPREAFKYSRARQARGQNANLNLPVSDFVKLVFDSKMSSKDSKEGFGGVQSQKNSLFNVEGQETFTVYRPTSVPARGIPLKAKSKRQVERSILWPTENLRVGEWFIVQTTRSQLNSMYRRLYPGGGYRRNGKSFSIRIDRDNSLVAVYRTV